MAPHRAKQEKLAAAPLFDFLVLVFFHTDSFSCESLWNLLLSLMSPGCCYCRLFCRSGKKEDRQMATSKFEVWIDLQNKIISFRQVPEWQYQRYESEKSMMEELDWFTLQGFRYQ